MGVGPDMGVGREDAGRVADAARRSSAVASDALGALLDRHPLPHLLVAPDDGRILALNDAARRLLAVAPGERLGPWPLHVEPREEGAVADLAAAPRQLVRLAAGDGELARVEVVEQRTRWEGRPALLLVVVAAAPSAARTARLIEQRRQGERMEAIGRLAGGVAHDLNNLLTVIRGHTELLGAGLAEDAEGRDDVERIREAAERASDLARQLLAFARRQVLTPAVVDLNATVDRLRPVLESLVAPHHALVFGLDPAAGSVRVDPSQLDQVVLNLALNARDAMPDGGTLLIETASIDVDPAFAALYPPLVPGRFALLAVSDDGMGLTPDARQHLFEPFFTTKEGGRGTGLGLATVYGIVRQSNGAISVFSEPGLGTTMRVYLPAVGGAAGPAPGAAPAGDAAARAGARAVETAGRTVLVVEDAPDIRRLLESVLRGAGFRVLAAPHAQAALAVLRSHEGPLDLLVTDVVMPGMSGRELAERASVDRPAMRVLFVSGLVEETFLEPGRLPAGSAFLAKPFDPERLVAVARELLAG